MDHSFYLNPNILLTEACNQDCPYCFARKKMVKSLKKEMSFNDFKKVVDFIKRNNQREIRLMGGEPTLHSRFKDMIDFVVDRGLRINIFTNGLFSNDLAAWLSAKGDFIFYNINLTTPASKTERGQELISRNLNIIGSSKFCASINIDSLDFGYESLVESIKKNNIQYVRLGAANNLIGDQNWLNFEQFKDLGCLICSFINELKKAGVRSIRLNCVTPCMFSEEQLNSLSENRIKVVGWECCGKKGAFEISSDLSIFFCFILEEFKAGNLFDFKNLEAAKKFIDRLLLYGSGNFFEFEQCRRCAYYKTLKCKIPCRGWVVNNSKKQLSFYRLRKTLYFKIIFRLLYLSRNVI